LKPLKTPGDFPLPPGNDQVAERLVDAFFAAGSGGGRLPAAFGSEYQNRKVAAKLAPLFDIVKGFRR
jgi:hypothetical protein